MPPRGLIFILSAPSGAGKTTVLKKVLERRPEVVYSISATTRPPRAGEQGGKDYFFTSTAEFRKGIEEGRFAEWAEVHGHLYGTPEDSLQSRTSAGEDVILDIDVQGAIQLKKRHPEAILIFLLPPSFQELEERLRGRKTESDEAVDRRLEVAKQEMCLQEAYDHVIVNNELERAADDVEAVVDQEKARRQAT
jgi:guanylate kinase